MFPLITAVFIASLFGSLHCVGMCGPLAMLASSHQSRLHKNQRRTNVQAVVAYHGSRVISYALAGLVAGLIGAGIQHTGSWFGWQRLAAQLAGGSMLVIGLLAIVRLAGGTSHTLWMPRWLQKLLTRGHAWARQQRPVARAATIGLLTAILPCGWLFAFLIVAAGTASAVSGAIVMAVFALGSVPALAGLAMSMTLMVGRFRRLVPWCSAVLVTIVGGATLVTRSHIQLENMLEPAPQTSSMMMAGTDTTSRTTRLTSKQTPKLAETVQAIESIDQQQLPCCQRSSNSSNNTPCPDTTVTQPFEVTPTAAASVTPTTAP